MSNIQDLVSAGGKKIYLYTGLGKNANLIIQFFNDDDVIINVSTWDVRLVIKATLDSSTDVLPELTGTLTTDGTDGKFTFDFDTVNITSKLKDAYMTVYRRVDGTIQYTLLQYVTDIVDNGQ